MIDIDRLIMEARKEQKKKKLQAYQNIKAELQLAMKAKNAKVFNEQSQIEIISKYVKRMKDAVSQFLDADRQDLAAEYREELSIIEKLLPKPVSKSDIYDLFEEERISKDVLEKYWIEEENQLHIEIPKKDMGTVIKYIKSKFPTADGKLISDIVKSYIV